MSGLLPDQLSKDSTAAHKASFSSPRAGSIHSLSGKRQKIVSSDVQSENAYAPTDVTGDEKVTLFSDVQQLNV